MLERFNPNLYSAKDANQAFAKIPDKTYSVGKETINAEFSRERSKVWSLEPWTLSRIENIIEDAHHFHYLPIIMGTYNMDSQKMRMNDLCATDPITLGFMADGHLEYLTIPFFRGLYFFGRSGWWRHESIHARHHHQMADFLKQRKGQDPRYYLSDRSDLNEAGYTIHESGIEEALTRWQSLKESNGVREKTTASLASLAYLEYAPFTGIRNFFTDVKDKIDDNLPEAKTRIPAKLALAGTIIAGPIVAEDATHIAHQLVQIGVDNLPFSQSQIDGLIKRGVVYTDIAAIAALFFSIRKKGALENGNKLTTSDYKFPYTYNPVIAFTRTIDFFRYLGRVWDNIPNYRELKSSKGIDKVKREIEDRISTRLNDNDQRFTMLNLEEALKAIEHRKRSQYPGDVYVKGLFTPALYLNLKNRYNGSLNSGSETQES